MKKRIYAWLLVLCLAIGLWMPAGASGSDWKLWSQGDSRWGDRSISSSGFERYTMRAQGCLITAIAKVLVQAGQQDPDTFTPESCLDALLAYGMLSTTGALLYGYRMNDEGFLAEYGPDLAYFTDPAHEPWDEETACQQVGELLGQGCYVIVRVYNSDSGSYHFMAVDRIENNRLYVMDNLAIIDLYATEKYGGVSDWLCFRRTSGSPVEPPPRTGLLQNFSILRTYQDGIFADVEAGKWFRDGVARAYSLGLVQGQGDGIYGVQSPFTVGAALTLAARMHAIYNTGAANFTESVPWYAVYVEYAVQCGISYYGQFDDYTRPATRAELAMIFAAALPEQTLREINTVPDGAIPDVPMDAPYAEAVYRLYRAGILTGDVNTGGFRPNANITRAEAACLAARVADYGLRQDLYLWA